MNINQTDFTGFTFDGIHSSELNIYRVSDGDRYDEELIPEINDRTTEIPGNNGEYFWGSNYGKRTFSIKIAYDEVTETQFRKIRRLFSTRKVVPLIFDERPYKVYYVKMESPIELNYICFDERKYGWNSEDHIGYIPGSIDHKEVDNNTRRIYKGEGTIELVAYYPYAHQLYKILNKYKSCEVWNYGVSQHCGSVGQSYNDLQFLNETTSNLGFYLTEEPVAYIITRFSTDYSAYNYDLIYSIIHDSNGTVIYGLDSDGIYQKFENNDIEVSFTVSSYHNYHYIHFKTDSGLRFQGRYLLFYVTGGEEFTFRTAKGVDPYRLTYPGVDLKFNLKDIPLSKTIAFTNIIMTGEKDTIESNMAVSAFYNISNNPLIINGEQKKLCFEAIEDGKGERIESSDYDVLRMEAEQKQIEAFSMNPAVFSDTEYTLFYAYQEDLGIKSEWAHSSGILTQAVFDEFNLDRPVATVGDEATTTGSYNYKIPVYNPGDENTGFYLYIPYDGSGEITPSDGEYIIINGDNGTLVLEPFEKPSDSDETGIMINTVNHLIEGVWFDPASTIDYVTPSWTTTGRVYNDHIKAGDFPKIFKSDWSSLDIDENTTWGDGEFENGPTQAIWINCEQAENARIHYNYLYY